VTTEKGELAKERKKGKKVYKNKKFINLDHAELFIFGVLVNVGKKVLCLQFRFKS